MHSAIIAAEAASGQPLWPYVAGGVVSIVLAIIGAITFYRNMRRDIEVEAAQKVENTEAVKKNTEEARHNTEAITALTRKLESFIEATNDAIAKNRADIRDLQWHTEFHGTRPSGRRRTGGSSSERPDT